MAKYKLQDIFRMWCSIVVDTMCAVPNSFLPRFLFGSMCSTHLAINFFIYWNEYAYYIHVGPINIPELKVWRWSGFYSLEIVEYRYKGMTFLLYSWWNVDCYWHIYLFKVFWLNINLSFYLTIPDLVPRDIFHPVHYIWHENERCYLCSGSIVLKYSHQFTLLNLSFTIFVISDKWAAIIHVPRASKILYRYIQRHRTKSENMSCRSIAIFRLSDSKANMG